MQSILAISAKNRQIFESIPNLSRVMPVPIASKRIFNSFSTYSYFVGVIIITVQWKLYWEEGGGY